MRSTLTARVVGAFTLAAGPAEALAHALSERYGHFAGALLHPLASWDHGSALVGLGLLAGQQAGVHARTAAWSAVLALTVGATIPLLAAIDAGPPSWLTTANSGLVLVAGGLVAAGWRIPSPALIAVSTLVALSHGVENGLDLATYSVPAWSGLAVGAAGLVIFPVAGLVTRMPAGWPRVAVRVAGSWIAALGLIMVGLGLRPMP